MNDKPQQQYQHILSIADDRGQRIVKLEENSYSLGRSAQRSIIINSRAVSRYHATLVKRKSPKGNFDVYFIIDGDLKGKRSTNGILINGIYKIYQQLRHGDIILLGCNSTYQKRSQIKYFKLSRKTVEHFLKSSGEIDEAKLSKIFARKESYKDTIIA